jgi:hypothetical protein
LSKNNIVVLDRLYSDLKTLTNLNEITNFVVRMKKNANYIKTFISENISEKIVMFKNGVILKLVRYHVDKTTKKLIITRDILKMTIFKMKIMIMFLYLQRIFPGYYHLMIVSICIVEDGHQR